MKKTEIGLIKMKQKPQTLVNLEKGRYFKSSYEYYKEWMDRYSEIPEREIPIMERVGIYCMVYSMLEDRLETFWWNCSFIHKWDVIPSDDDPKLKRPPKRKEWEKRKIPKRIRQTGSYLRLLEMNEKITMELKTRVRRSDDDRREIIHKNMFNMKDATKDHIQELMSLFREFEKLIKKHKKKHSDKFDKS